jgi:hypothetical protein
MRERVERFTECDRRFYPYILAVLERMPEDVGRTKILDDAVRFQILSFGTCAGRYCNMSDQPPSHIVLLNESILNEPEEYIIHTIAHEFAHRVLEHRGISSLAEKEAEELLVMWGFGQASENQKGFTAIVEEDGCKLGYEWARSRSDLDHFEQYFEDWNKGNLDVDYYFELLEIADLPSIMESIEANLSNHPSWLPLYTARVADAVRFDRGFVHGVMVCLKEGRRV